MNAYILDLSENLNENLTGRKEGKITFHSEGTLSSIVPSIYIE